MKTNFVQKSNQTLSIVLKGLIFLLIMFVGSEEVDGQQLVIEWYGEEIDLIQFLEDKFNQGNKPVRFAIEGHTDGVDDRITFKIREVDALTLYEGGFVRLVRADTITSSQDSTASNIVRLPDGTLAARQYKIGDMTHGGIVFWVDETGEHGLVCSLNDLESPSMPGDFLHQWSSIDTTTGATGGTVANGSFDGKGAGAMNTMLIVSADRADTDSAARLCADLIKGGYGDWYLPSKGELHLMYTNLHLAGLGGFAADFYWSSTEFDDSVAWGRDFGGGIQDSDGKGGDGRVRAIRAF